MLHNYLERFKRFKSLVHYYLLDETNKNMPLDKRVEQLDNLSDNYVTKEDELTSDINLSNMVREDISQINNELPLDGIYNWELQKPVIRVLRDGDDIKVYGLIPGGGILLYYKKGLSSSSDSYQIHSLGEDDGFYFLESRNFYEPIYCTKVELVSLFSEVLATFNSIEK